MYSYVYKCSNDEERKFLTSPHEICKKNKKKNYFYQTRKEISINFKHTKKLHWTTFSHNKALKSLITKNQYENIVFPPFLNPFYHENIPKNIEKEDNRIEISINKKKTEYYKTPRKCHDILQEYFFTQSQISLLKNKQFEI